MSRRGSADEGFAIQGEGTIPNEALVVQGDGQLQTKHWQFRVATNPRRKEIK